MLFIVFSGRKHLDPSLRTAMTPWMINSSLHQFRLHVFMAAMVSLARSRISFRCWFLPSVSWKIAQSFFGRSLQDIRVFKRDHFATSLTFSWTAAESRVTGSLVKECDLYIQIFCMFLYVLLNIIKKLSFQKCPYLCLQSKFYKTHVSVSF